MSPRRLPGRPHGLIGRVQECRLLEELVNDARDGRSRVLTVRGEPGMGKSALLEHAVESARGFQIARATGVESEMELPFAGLHQLCGPMLDRLALLPGPQREAVSTAFGLTTGRPPDLFIIGLALLSLLSEASEQAPLLCVVDDAHWLDRASAHALAFAARRLLADRVCLLFGVRHPAEYLSGLPELVIDGLADNDARALLGSVPGVPIDERVRDRIIEETRGNPLALLEWPRALSPAELAGGFGLPARLTMRGQIEERFQRRFVALPAPAQRFLTVAAAEPPGDPVVVWRAAGRLGVRDEDASPAIDEGLIEIGTRVRFRHPSVRSAVYAAAAADDRRAAHRALADVTDPATDPDRRAWHLALAAPAPDEDVAGELERCAGLAQARGGLAAAAALLERSAALTLDASRRVERSLAAAGAHIEAGAPEAAASLLAIAGVGAVDEFTRARVDLLRGYAAASWGHTHEAADLFLSSAKRLERIDVRLARDTYINALGVAVGGTGLAKAARAARAAPPSNGSSLDLLLDGLAMSTTDGPVAAAPVLRQALSALGTEHHSIQDRARWIGQYQAAATLLWDHERFHLLGIQAVDAARAVGDLRILPFYLDALAVANVFGGDLTTAAALVTEAESCIRATRSTHTPWAAAQIAGWNGIQAEAETVIRHAITEAGATGHGVAIQIAEFASATLYNGLGRYDLALIAAQRGNRDLTHWSSHLTLHELVEAAVRSGETAVAAEALHQLVQSTQASGTDWARGVEARSRALLSAGDEADALYLEAIERLDRSPVRSEAARAHLLYGEWLRRENRRVDARPHLRMAYEQLTTMGMEAFAERANRELGATGETVRKRSVETRFELTPQELQIARLAADGCTNGEIGSQLFLSARTVEWHLRKVFAKLGVSSRKELRDRAVRPGASSSAQ